MRAHLLALFTVFVWGVTFVCTKVLLVDFTPLWILMLRFILGFAALCVLRPRVLRLARPSHERLFAAAGLTGIAAYYLLENVALTFTTATAVGVIVAVSPLFTALISAALGKGRPQPRFFVGFCVAMAGLCLVSFGGEAAGPDAAAVASAGLPAGWHLLGDGLAVLAGLVWAVYSLLVQRIAEEGYETIAATKRIFLWGLVAIVPATLAFGGALPAAAAFAALQNFGNLLFLGLVASAVCFVTWGLVVENLGPVRSTTYIYLVPAITAVASVIVLGEPMTPAIVVGLGLTMGGLALSQGGSATS